MITNGRVFSIEEFSAFDGPGIRTTVFLKGCLLSCEWCHNPEGQSFDIQILKNNNGCIDCEKCLDASEIFCGKRIITEASIPVCPEILIRKSGTDYTADELAELLEKNSEIFKLSGGGVTFSGGEPLAQYDFLCRTMELLRGKIPLAIQTSGYCENKKFKNILKLADYILFDLKLIDREKHILYTGVDNRPILRNFGTLCACGVPYVVRVPLIPSVTDTAENIEGIARLMKENGADYAELLPYNKIAGAKYSLSGREYKPTFDGNAEIKTHTEIFDNYSIKVKIM